MYDFATGNAKFSLKKPKVDGAKGTTGGQGASGVVSSTDKIKPRDTTTKGNDEI